VSDGMRTPVEHIRLSQEARDRLITLKRKTKIQTWNVLCRWGFCRSLAEPTPPPLFHIPADSNVEMDWRTFAGPISEVLLALLRLRCLADGLALTEDVLSAQFRLHLHRGISYLAADASVKDIGGLCALASAEGPISAA
jgi:DNA sulfur modification protein DndE